MGGMIQRWSIQGRGVIQLECGMDQRDQRGVSPAVCLKLRWTGTLLSTNETGLFLVGSLGFLRFLFCLGCSSRPRTKYFFSSPFTLVQLFCPHRLASWVDSRAGLPVSQYVSLGPYKQHSAFFYHMHTLHSRFALNMYPNMFLYPAIPDLKKNHTFCFLFFFCF